MKPRRGVDGESLTTKFAERDARLHYGLDERVQARDSHYTEQHRSPEGLA